MNQSIRATEPTKMISLQRYTDCVIFDPENQQIILTSNDLCHIMIKTLLNFNMNYL